MKSYSEMLLDPRWQRRRLEILDRAGFSCEVCEATTRTLHVHHRIYRKGAAPWEYADDELQALCDECHGQHHKWRTRLHEAIAKLEDADVERVVGYIDGLLAEGLVFNDLPEDQQPTDREIPLHSWQHATGFADSLGIRRSADRVDRLLALMPLRLVDVFGLSVDGLPIKEGESSARA